MSSAKQALNAAYLALAYQYDAVRKLHIAEWEKPDGEQHAGKLASYAAQFDVISAALAKCKADLEKEK